MDVTVTGNAVWIAGSDYDTGTITLRAKGIKASRVDLDLAALKRTEIRSDSSGVWTSGDQVVHPIAEHNLWTDAAWFFPVLGSLATVTDTEVVISDLGATTRDGISVRGIRIQRVPARVSAKASKLIQHLSEVDVYLDSRTLLPLFVTFTLHPDDDALTDIPSEVRFADYRSVNGVRVPFRIQKLLNGGLVLDVTVTSATINSGLSDSLFSLQ